MIIQINQASPSCLYKKGGNYRVKAGLTQTGSPQYFTMHQHGAGGIYLLPKPSFAHSFQAKGFLNIMKTTRFFFSILTALVLVA
ncbi:MAG TPA: hypothetical protein PLF72_11130, partial [Anaerolineaceae bacterium]|nr:hypothetical protein [Anaerolineaceae bacterium]